MAERGWRERAEFAFDQMTDEESVRRLVNADAAHRWTAYVLGVFYLLRLNYPELVRSGPMS